MREITEELTSDITIASYVEKLKDSLFPDGYPAQLTGSTKFTLANIKNAQKLYFVKSRNLI